MARDTLTAPAADADADAGTRRKLRLPRAALGLLLPVLALLAAPTMPASTASPTTKNNTSPTSVARVNLRN